MNSGHEQHAPHSGRQSSETSLLAWAGWRLELPRTFEPLKLSGTPDKGQMIVGDNDCAMLLLQWTRPPQRGAFDGRAWVVERLRKLGLHPDPEDRPPAHEHFTACGWARAVQTEEDKQTTHWFAYDHRARLLLRVTVNGVLPEALRETLEQQVLPTLRPQPEDEPATWSMYDLGFVAPAGFALSQRHLFSGDVALEFVRGPHETLLLRQVYPGDLALGRRTHEQWLDCYPFPLHRRPRRASLRTEPWCSSRQPGLSGLRRHVWQRLPVPMGWCSPRQSSALAVHDTVLNRLLLVEHRSRSTPDDTLCTRAVEQMNAGCRVRASANDLPAEGLAS